MLLLKYWKWKNDFVILFMMFMYAYYNLYICLICLNKKLLNIRHRVSIL